MEPLSKSGNKPLLKRFNNMLPNTFKEYLVGIDLTPPLIERVEKIHTECKKLGLDVDSDIFVTEIVDGEGKRNYQSLWLFGPEIGVEAKNFIGEDNYDQVRL